MEGGSKSRGGGEEQSLFLSLSKRYRTLYNLILGSRQDKPLKASCCRKPNKMRSAFVFLVIFVVSQGYLEIDELRKMVTDKNDRRQLAVLERDRRTPRSQIKEQVDGISAKQANKIQVGLVVAKSRFVEVEVFQD